MEPVKRLLLVFFNEPLPETVNAHIALEIGQDEAARYYKAMVEVLFRQLQGLEDCRIRFCYAPHDAGDAIRFWLLPLMRATMVPGEDLYLVPSSNADDTLNQEVDFRPQGDGDLGARLERAFAGGFAEGYGNIAVIGPNCPECGARWVNGAFSRLVSESARDAVIGPGSRGSYYLLALKSHAPELFENIPWNSDDVFAATLYAARRAGLYFDTLPRLPEIISLRDWKKTMDSPLGPAFKKALGEPIGDLD